MRPLEPEFEFAGFAWPRHVASLPSGGRDARDARARLSTKRGPKSYQYSNGTCYYHAPKPIKGGAHPGKGFYLSESAGPFQLRWAWADEVLPSIRHTGWFCDEHQCDKIRGLVMRLPRGRGFLAGWSMGEGMASAIDGWVHDDIEDAARAADSMAEEVAEAQREYEEAESARLNDEEGSCAPDTYEKAEVHHVQGD